MALHLQELGEATYRFCITPTGRELPPMVEHWKHLECLLGQELIRIPAPSLVDLILKYKALPNWRMRWCTRQIKIEPFMAYAAASAPAVCYGGLRSDEGEDRDGTNWNGVEGVTQATPLVSWGWGIGKVIEYLRTRGVVVPERSDCDWCFWQRMGEWWRLWRDWPQQWREGEAVELLTGHTFRSDQRDSWPASMVEMRKKFEAGFVPKDAAQTLLPMDVSTRSAMCAWCAR